MAQAWEYSVVKDNDTIRFSDLFTDHRGEKLVHAIAWFSHNAKHCHTLKLFNLLYFLDFESFRQMGSSVTGLDYYAFPQGPVPLEMVREASDYHTDGWFLKSEFLLDNDFDTTYFSPRELEIMEELILLFGETKSDDIIEYSLDSNFPWKKIYDIDEGSGRVVSYHLALQSEPIVDEHPTIDKEHVDLLDELFEGTGLR